MSIETITIIGLVITVLVLYGMYHHKNEDCQFTDDDVKGFLSELEEEEKHSKP